MPCGAKPLTLSNQTFNLETCKIYGGACYYIIMSNKLQDTKSTRTVLILIGAVIIGVTGWYVLQSKDKANESLGNAALVQTEDTAVDEYSGWKTHTWEGQGLTFKYPDNWFLEEKASMSRIYVKNSEVDLLKEETPADFQQLWLSYDRDEASAAREEAIKNGKSAYRVVRGEVTAGTIQAGDLTINTYEYETLGGPTLEAYWTGADGKRYYATNSTEVGEENQTEMVAALKKLLASISQQSAGL
jgi:hypothetical protein